MFWLWLGLKAAALARPRVALAQKNPRPGQTIWLWLGPAWLWPGPRLTTNIKGTSEAAAFGLALAWAIMKPGQKRTQAKILAWLWLWITSCNSLDFAACLLEKFPLALTSEARRSPVPLITTRILSAALPLSRSPGSSNVIEVTASHRSDIGAVTQHCKYESASTTYLVYWVIRYPRPALAKTPMACPSSPAQGPGAIILVRLRRSVHTSKSKAQLWANWT
ncbi:hypothetical protein B0H17DRAFT_1147500 [Mycena rosella]|uniref:Uncharacterized protein n=1 Tax=Mycena rosella TaxID=1033263 RepID=A0AAD7CM66_MYCRO|nr:hypothetical protein B0H17DRAFT_1147500 [Mycena rosella]